MFQIVRTADDPDFENKRFDDRTDCFTLQLRGAGEDDTEIEFSDEVADNRQLNLQLKIQNVSLALIVLKKNTKLLKMLLLLHPGIFFSAKREQNG